MTARSMACARWLFPVPRGAATRFNQRDVGRGEGRLNAARIALSGHAEERNGVVYKITIERRPPLDARGGLVATAAALPMLPPVPVMTQTFPESLSDDTLVIALAV
jgi:hypothetical protein